MNVGRNERTLSLYHCQQGKYPAIDTQLATGGGDYQRREVSSMLIPTRRVGETLIIELPTGEEIRVIVSNRNGNQVRLGTKAPWEIKVSREEIRDKLSA